MPFQDLVTKILDPGLCTTCGICAAACPPAAIEVTELHPVFVRDSEPNTCATCNDCLQSCPGYDTGTPAAESELFGRTRTVDERWVGVVRRRTGAAATDPEILARSASGGAATVLLQTAMRSMKLDVVLVAGRNSLQPWLAAPLLCRTPGEIVDGAQSTYQLFPHLEALSPLLRERGSTRIGLSGLACHIQAVRKLQRMPTELGRAARERIVFALEVACSSNTTPEGTASLIEEECGIALETVSDVRFRDGEYPGQVAIRTKDGGVRAVPFWRAVDHFKGHKTHRCLSCADWMSGLADVSVCDGDQNIFETSRNGEQAPPKYGRIFCRTESGERVFEEAVRTGALVECPAGALTENLGLDRKKNRRMSYERGDRLIPLAPIAGHRLEGEVIPDEVLLAERDPGRKA